MKQLLLQKKPRQIERSLVTLQHNDRRSPINRFLQERWSAWVLRQRVKLGREPLLQLLAQGKS